MSVQRINEINMAAGALVGKTMQALLGTDKERAFLTSAMDRGVGIVERLRTMVAEGITFDSWREYFMDVNAAIGVDENFEEADRAQLKLFTEELQVMDLNAYYETIVLPFLNLQRLDQDVIEMNEHREMMNSIWAEEDEENGVASSKEAA